SSGNLLLANAVDHTGPGGKELFSYDTTKADTYYVAIFGFGAANNDAPPSDPSVPGTGTGAGTTGPYNLTITMHAIGPGTVQQENVPIQQGQTLLLLVGGEGNSTGAYDLQITSLDQFSTPDNASLVFPAGAGPSQLAVGDLNGDGKPDIVVSNAQTNTVSV